MIEMDMLSVFREIEDAIGREDYRRAEALIFPAIDQFPKLPQCYLYAGSFFFRTGRNALAELCYRKSIDLDPTPGAIGNLGAALRQMNRNDEALEVLKKGLELSPDDANLLANVASCYVNEGNPDPGIEAAEKALALNPESVAGSWNLGLLYLETGQFAKGWTAYRRGVGKQRLLRSYTEGGEPPLLTPETHDPGKGKLIIVWGEQGIGDELMMGSMLHDLKRDYEVVFDCHPRLEWLHRTAHPDLRIYPTRKDEWINWPVEDRIKPDLKCGLGDLGAIYRNSRADFAIAWQTHGPFYSAPEEETREYREVLEGLAEGRQIIGLATRGGTPNTMRDYRKIDPELLSPLLSRDDLMFVALDYEDVVDQCAEINRTYAQKIFNFPSIADAWDYHHTAALVEACDAVVTVCQSVAHLSAGMGKRTHVLVPSKPAWRYGLKGDVWYWYPGENIRLHRQNGADWTPAIREVVGEL